MLVGAAVTVVGALVAAAAALWAGLLALGEEAAVGEVLHTLGDAPPATVGGRVPLHRALHVARLALLVLAAVAAGDALGWWTRPWAAALGAWGVAVGFLFVVGDALPRSVAHIAPELASAALPLARRTLVPFGLLLWVLAWLDRGLHRLVATPRPLQPTLGVAQRDMLLGVFTLADTRVDEVMTPRLDMIAVDLAAATEEVVDAFRQSEHSRLPVYDGTPDNIVGVVFAKDLVPVALGMEGAANAAGAAGPAGAGGAGGGGGGGGRRRSDALAAPRATRLLRARDQDARQPAARFPAWAGASRDRGGRVRRHVGLDHARGHPRGNRGRDS